MRKHFTEEQSFGNIPFWVLIGLSNLVINFVLGKGLMKRLNAVVESSATAMSVNEMIILIVALNFIFLLVIWLFIRMKLYTEINSKGLAYRYPPLINKQRTILISDISSWRIRKYRPILEYGGWGIRKGMKGTAYNVKGNMGLQIVTNSGKKILIGTQKPTALERAMKKIMEVDHV